VSGAAAANLLLLFDDISDAIAADSALKASGHPVSLVAPPFDVRAGCDLALSIPSGMQDGAIGRLMESDIRVTGVVTLGKGATHLTEIVVFVDFGEWLMVRAGNMKITAEKRSGLIVNVSGGGCPDIPYLSYELVGLTLAQAPRPRELGDTICGLMLDRAFIEIKNCPGMTSR